MISLYYILIYFYSNREELVSCIENLKSQSENTADTKHEIISSTTNGNSLEKKETDEPNGSPKSADCSKSEGDEEKCDKNGDSSHTPSSPPVSEDKSDCDSPEAARGVNSPVVSSSPARVTRNKRNSAVSDTSSPSRKNIVKKSPVKKGSKKTANKKRKPDNESDSDESTDGSEKSPSQTKEDPSSSSSSDEEPLSQIRTPSGRNPRAAAAKAVQKIVTPSSTTKARSKRKEPTPEPSEEESEESEENEEEEYVPASAKRTRGKGRGRCATTPKATVVPISASRSKRKSTIPEPEPEPVDSSEVEDDTECMACHKFNHPGKLLLCDSCDSGYHTFCLVPKLEIIPDGEWFCPNCEHFRLIENLNYVLIQLDAALKELAKKQAKEKAGRKELMKLMDDPWYGKRKSNGGNDDLEEPASDQGVSSAEDDDFGVRRCRRRNKVDYSLSEYDKKLQDAISGRFVEEQNNGEGRRQRGLHEGKQNGDFDEDEDEEEKPNPEDFEVPEWAKEDAGESTPRNRSRMSAKKESDDEYRPSEDEADSPRKKRIESSEEEEDEEEVEEESPEPKKEPKKRPKNWEEEDYTVSWDEESRSEWDSEEMSDFGGKKKRSRKTDTSGKKKRKGPRFLYASSESDSDNSDYNTYKKKSKLRHNGRRKFPSSEEEEETASSESSSGSDFTGRKRPKRGATKKKKASKKLAKVKPKNKRKRAKDSNDDEEVDETFDESLLAHRSARLAARGRVKYVDEEEDEEEQKAKKKKKQEESRLGKIRLPFEAESGDEEENSEEDVEEEPVKPRVIESSEEDKEEEEESVESSEEEEEEEKQEKVPPKIVEKKDESTKKPSPPPPQQQKSEPPRPTEEKPKPVPPPVPPESTISKPLPVVPTLVRPVAPTPAPASASPAVTPVRPLATVAQQQQRPPMMNPNMPDPRMSMHGIF